MQIRITIAIVITVVLVLTACSRPPVNYAIGPGDTRTIEHWQIEWVDTEPNQTLFPGIPENMTTQSQYSIEVNARDYVRKVRRHLSDHHGLSFATNFPAYGRIEISMSSSKVARLLQKQAEDPHKQELDRDLQTPANDPRYHDAPEDSVTIDVAVSELLFDTPDWVTFVEVRILDSQGQLAHRIQIGGESHEDISPKYVADKIAELLTRDRKRKAVEP